MNEKYAFPLHIPATLKTENGMTLRDYFAAKALQGYLASWDECISPSPEHAAEKAYLYADAMMKQRAVARAGERAEEGKS